MRAVAIFTVHNLTCEYSDQALFQPITLQVQPGDLLQVVGGNGAGKTTLLHTLAGLREATTGTISWNQRPLVTERYSFQQELLFLGHRLGVKLALTPYENLVFYQQLRNKTPLCSIMEALQRVGLAAEAHELLAHLSVGQVRRVALARCWLESASLWILDEPFTGLDQHGVNLMTDRIEQHLLARGSVIFTSHQPIPFTHKCSTLELRVSSKSR